MRQTNYLLPNPEIILPEYHSKNQQKKKQTPKNPSGEDKRVVPFESFYFQRLTVKNTTKKHLNESYYISKKKKDDREKGAGKKTKKQADDIGLDVDVPV
jgi:hypothetical protein